MLSSLNEEQQAVVKTIDGKILCVAGAGTGKTTTLVHRVAYLISECQVNPENILLLTFTRNAAKSMLNKCQAIEPLARKVNGGTFHFFGIELIKKFINYLNFPTNFTIIDEEDSEDIIANCIKLLKAKEKIIGVFPKAKTIRRIISNANNNNISILSVAEKENISYLNFKNEIDTINKYYIEYKKNNGLVDFDDCLKIANQLLDNKDVLEYVHNKYKYIMVDEYQDTNLIQAELIKKIVGEDGNIMAVGDPSQSIYAFRGAVAKNMFNFTSYWPNVKIMPLNLNYRSTQEILDVVNIFETFMNDRFDRNLTSFNGRHGNPPEFTIYLDKEDEAKKICDNIIKYNDNNIPLKEQAVLFRNSFISRHIEIELINRKIPYKIFGGIKISKASHVKDLLSFIRILVNPNNELAWQRLLVMLPNIGLVTARKFIKNITLANSFEECLEKFFLIIQYENINKKNSLEYLYYSLKSMINEQNIEKMLLEIISLYENIFIKFYKDEWRWRKKDLILICNLSKNFSLPDEFINTLTLDYSIDKMQDNGSNTKITNDFLTLSTIHSAKGLEWKIVYIPTLRYGHIPSAYAFTEEELEEEKRIFYVAITRAKDFIHLSNISSCNSGEIIQNSPFIQYIEDKKKL